MNSKIKAKGDLEQAPVGTIGRLRVSRLPTLYHRSVQSQEINFLREAHHSFFMIFLTIYKYIHNVCKNGRGDIFVEAFLERDKDQLLVLPEVLSK